MSDVIIHLSPYMEAKLADPTFPHTHEEVVAHMERLYKALKVICFDGLQIAMQAENIKELITGESAALVDWDSHIESSSYPLLYMVAEGRCVDLEIFSLCLAQCQNPNTYIGHNGYTLLQELNEFCTTVSFVKAFIRDSRVDLDARSQNEACNTILELLSDRLNNSRVVVSGRLGRTKDLIAQGAILPEEAYRTDSLKDTISELQSQWNAWKDDGMLPETITQENIIAFRALGKLEECFADKRWEGKEELALMKIGIAGNNMEDEVLPDALRPSFQYGLAPEKLRFHQRIASKQRTPLLGAWQARVSAPNANTPGTEAAL